MNKCCVCGKEFEGRGYSASPFFKGMCCSDCFSYISYEKSLDKGSYKFSNKHHCNRCGHCCTDFIPLTHGEIALIKEYIKTHNVQRNISNSDSGELMIMCPFLGDNCCQIYDVRPGICKGFKCGASPHKILRNKIYYNVRADINTIETGFESLHSIFFGDKAYSDWLMKNIEEGNVK